MKDPESLTSVSYPLISMMCVEGELCGFYSYAVLVLLAISP